MAFHNSMDDEQIDDAADGLVDFDGLDDPEPPDDPDTTDVSVPRTRGALEEGRARAVYEVADWPVIVLDGLVDALEVARISHEWDEFGDLHVHEEDEEAVDAIFDSMPDVDDPDRLEPGALDAQDILTTLWQSTERLSKRPDDPESVLSAANTIDRLEQMSVPFGIVASEWRRLVRKGTRLRAGLESPDDEDHLDDESLMALAAELSALSRRFL